MNVEELREHLHGLVDIWANMTLSMGGDLFVTTRVVNKDGLELTVGVEEVVEEDEEDGGEEEMDC